MLGRKRRWQQRCARSAAPPALMSARASHARLRRSPVLPSQVAGAWESGRAPPTWHRRPEKEETKVQRAYGRGPPLHKGGLKMRSSTTGNCGPDDAFLPEKSGRPWATALALYGCSVLGVPVFLPGQSGGAGALELPARRGPPITRCPPSTFHFLPCRKAPAWESASARWYFERGFRALPVPSREYRSVAETAQTAAVAKAAVKEDTAATKMKAKAAV